jgi:catechol 2,3-dioxygenase-like lactoylglutathione lyase family enzyme
MGTSPEDHGARDPFLRMHAVNVYVRDQERSLRFYLDTLGFQVAFDARVESGQRLVAVAPPDGTTVLTLIQPPPHSLQSKLIGRATQVVFVTENLAATYREWHSRGVRFRGAPRLRRVAYEPAASPAAAERSPSDNHATAWGGAFVANLRSQCATAVEQPEQLLRSVNRLFYENTAENAYATLFYSEFDDRTCRLRYANCGHLPGLVVQSDGTVKRLSSTAAVLGLFTEWPCRTEELQLCPGDLFAIYTDGITEALNQGDEEFGEERLLDVLRRARDLSPSHIVTAAFEEVRRFSGDQQRDDVTLIVARCRSREPG